MKKEFKKYIDKAVERFYQFHELKCTNEDIRAFSVMLQIDAMTSQPPSSTFWESLVELTKEQKKHLKSITK